MPAVATQPRAKAVGNVKTLAVQGASALGVEDQPMFRRLARVLFAPCVLQAVSEPTVAACHQASASRLDITLVAEELGTL